MNERIVNHVESLFSGTPRSKRAQELKDELIANLTDRYNDLLAQGKDAETAYATTVAGIGDIDEVLRGLREYDLFDPVQMQMQRQKSAILTSVAVAIYILSFIFPVIFDWTNGAGQIVGLVLMFVCWAAATMLIVYNALSKPKYVKLDDTIVEDFKEWKSGKIKSDAMMKSIASIVWLLALIVFFLLGFFGNLWHVAWLVFLLAPVVNHIIKLVNFYREVD